MEHGADVLGALVGNLDRDVAGMSGERGGQVGLLARGLAVPSGAEDVPDAVERITFPAAVVEGLPLDPAASIINSLAGEIDDVEGVQRRDRPSRIALGRDRAAARPGAGRESYQPSR